MVWVVGCSALTSSAEWWDVQYVTPKEQVENAASPRAVDMAPFFFGPVQSRVRVLTISDPRLRMSGPKTQCQLSGRVPLSSSRTQVSLTGFWLRFDQAVRGSGLSGRSHSACCNVVLV